MESDSGDNYERFVQLLSKNEPQIRAFLRSMLYSWNDVDEVMQNTSLVLWRKFSKFEADSNFLAWACTIARFEVLSFRRSKARDRHVFSEDLIKQLSETAQDYLVEEASDEREALQFCLRKLPETLRKSLLAAYEPGVKIREVAQEVGKTANAFYKILNRTRASLLNCITEQLTLKNR